MHSKESYIPTLICNIHIYIIKLNSYASKRVMHTLSYMHSKETNAICLPSKETYIYVHSNSKYMHPQETYIDMYALKRVNHL